MRSFSIASGAAGRDVSSPRSHQMWWIPGPNRPRILQVNIFETSDLDLFDLCWMSPDPLRWQLWRSEWWCPETHVRLRGFLSNCAHVVLFFSVFWGSVLECDTVTYPMNSGWIVVNWGFDRSHCEECELLGAETGQSCPWCLQHHLSSQ